MRIWDPGWKKLGSGMFIPDPQHFEPGTSTVTYPYQWMRRRELKRSLLEEDLLPGQDPCDVDVLQVEHRNVQRCLEQPRDSRPLNNIIHPV